MVHYIRAKLRAQLYELGPVLTESINEEGDWIMEIRMTPDQKTRLFNQPKDLQ